MRFSDWSLFLSLYKALLEMSAGDSCVCETPCNVTRYGKELSMVKIPSKGSARFLSRKYHKTEEYIRWHVCTHTQTHIFMLVLCEDLNLSSSLISNLIDRNGNQNMFDILDFWSKMHNKNRKASSHMGIELVLRILWEHLGFTNLESTHTHTQTYPIF